MERQRIERHGDTGDSRRYGETEYRGRHGETGNSGRQARQRTAGEMARQGTGERFDTVDRGRVGHGEGGQKKSYR